MQICIACNVYLLSKDGWLDGWLDRMMSNVSIVSKWLKISNLFLGLVALPLCFCNSAIWLQNSNGKGTTTRVDLENFRSYNTEQWPCYTSLQPVDTFTPSTYNMVAKHLLILFLPLDDKMLLPSLFLMSTTKPALHQQL